MVPIVELLNHECTDVYYDFFFKEENTKKPSVLNKIKYYVSNFT